MATVATELAEAPELWHQRAYLARVFTVDPDRGLVDDGVQPLAHFLDAGGPDALAVTLEADGTARSTRSSTRASGGEIQERMLEPDPLLRYDGRARRGSAVAAIVREVVPERRPVEPTRAQARRASRPAAAPSVSSVFGKANRSFVRPSSGSREERRARDRRHARVADQPVGERHVVLVRAARSRMSVMT